MNSLCLPITDHALVRYRERFNGNATREEVQTLAEAATPAPAWVAKCIRLGEKNQGGEVEYIVNGPVVFVVRKNRYGKPVVVTCQPLAWAEQTKRFYGKKINKFKNHQAKRSFHEP